MYVVTDGHTAVRQLGTGSMRLLPLRMDVLTKEQTTPKLHRRPRTPPGRWLRSTVRPQTPLDFAHEVLGRGFAEGNGTSSK